MNKGLIAAVLCGLLAACGGGGGSSTGKITMGVSDAPVDDADEVVVTFTGIELLGGPDGTRSFTFATPQQVDLLLQQGDQQFFLIQDEVVPAGVYQEVRLLTDVPNASCSAASADPDPASYIRIGNDTFPLIVPSGGSSGFKVKGPITVAAGGSAAYTVDFDLRKSIAERGTTGCYNLKPVLRVVDNAQIGTLAGTVDPGLLAVSGCTADTLTGEGAAVYVFQGADVVPDDFDNNPPEPLTTGLLTPVVENEVLTGFSYEIGFLLTGSYTVAFSCQAGDDAPPVTSDPADGDDTDATGPLVLFVQPTNATIAANTTTTVDFTVAPVDTDGDGVPDTLDTCPGTPTGTTVDAAGCPVGS